MSHPSAAELPPIHLEQVLLEGGANSHKQMSGEESLRPVYIPFPLISVTGERIDPTKQGGCFELTLGGLVIIGTLNHPGWRTEENDPVARAGNFMVLKGLGSQSAGGRIPKKGKEAELFAVGDDGKDVAVSGPNDKHPELFGFQIERATAPFSDRYELGLALYEALLDASGFAKLKGAKAYPGSNLAHRPMTVEDINSHIYVLRVARHLETLRRNGRLDANVPSPQLTDSARLSWLDGSAAQNTVGDTFTYADSAVTANMYSASFAPLLMRYSAASPFSGGRVNPTFPEQFRGIRPANGFLATRYYGRKLGSPEAGPLEEPFPTNVEDFKAKTHIRMRDGLMPSAGRTGGQHRDVRKRPEHAPFGALEFCARDTSGWDIRTNVAMALFEEAYAYTIAKANNSGNIERLARDHPRIVNTSISQKHLVQAEINSEILAQDSPEQKITALNGEEATPDQLWFETMGMVIDETRGTEFQLPGEVWQILTMRSITPNFDSPRGRDHEGFVDMGEFWKSGIGTLAHYQKELCKELINRKGLSEPDAIAEVQLRTSIAFEAYLMRFNPEKELAFLHADVYDPTGKTLVTIS